ncbi:MAG: hypothetical protein KDA77_17990, partial [Planctomycetaceae bacterium]|nr:hypothetical protein [Planctomycetaceae bacterium]
MKSLLSRLSLGLSLSLILLFGLQWWVVNAAVREVAENYVVTRLVHDSESILTAISFATGQMDVDQSSVDVIYQKPFSGHYYLVRSPDQSQQRSRSLWDKDFPAFQDTTQAQYLPGPDRQTLLVIVRDYRKAGHNLRIAVAEDMTPLLKQLEEFGERYALLSLLVLGIVLALQAIIAKISLRPLQLVIEDMRQLELGEVTALREEVPAEIHPLVREFNRISQLMRERLERSRAALGNLAHALKTPLTVMVRLEDSQAVQQQPELQRQLKEQTDMMRQIIDRQLKRARLAGVSMPGLNFEAEKEFRSLVEILEQIYAERELSIELMIPSEKSFAGDREDMLELFGNLLDNACKWARHTVRLTVRDIAGLVVIVEDDGPGCPTE